MQGVGYVEDDGQAAAGLLHDAEAEHIDDEVVVAEVGTAFAQDDLSVACFLEFFNDVFHLRGAEELGFFDVDDVAGFCHGDDEVGLAGEEGGQLDDVADFGDGGALVGFVDVGDDGYVKLAFDGLEDFHAFVQADAAKRMNGGAVGFVEGGFEDVGDAEFVGHFNVLFAGFEGEIEVFQDVDAAEQGKGEVVADGEVVDADVHDGGAFSKVV